MGDADHRLPAPAEAEGLVGVGRGGAGDGVGLLFPLRLLGRVDVVAFLFLQVEGKGKLLVFVPGHLLASHPERGDLNGMLGLFVLGAVGFRRGASHHESAAGNRHHLKLDFGCRVWFRRKSSSRRATVRRRFLRRRPGDLDGRKAKHHDGHGRRHARNGSRSVCSSLFGSISSQRGCRQKQALMAGVRSSGDLVRVSEGKMGLRSSGRVAPRGDRGRP